MSLPPGPFGAILADPPWSFRTYSGDSSVPTQAADPYATMGHEALKALPVGEVAAKDCALFMWIVDAHLVEALALGEAWGFTFKTSAFLWTKSRGANYDLFAPQHALGMGYWTRKQAELCLLFTRGHPSRLNADVRQIIDAPRREHSRKPDDQYERIERLVGGPYLEMFARQTRPGWTAWGNEVGKFGEAA